MWRSWKRFMLLVGMQMLHLLGKIVWQFFKKLNIQMPCDPHNSTPRYIAKRIENRCSRKYMYMHVYSRTTAKVRNSSNVHQMMNISIHEILFSHNKEWRTDACYSVGEPWKYCAKWKTEIKGVVWFYLYEISTMGKSIETECRPVFARDCRQVRMGSLVGFTLEW